MSYCQRCGEKNKSGAQFCGNCGTALPPDEAEKLQPGYGYDIHSTDCKHRLKLEPMTVRSKLTLLGQAQFYYLADLLLIAITMFLLLHDLFCTDIPLWQEYIGRRTGLFGPDGTFLSIVYFFLLMAALSIAARPLYTRCTYNSKQLLLPLLLQAMLPPIIGFTALTDRYFGSYLGTTPTTAGWVLSALCVVSCVLHCFLVRHYRQLKRSGVYHYVAN